MQEHLPASSPYAIVVEPNALIRMDAIDILEEAGFRVLEASTEDEAIKLLHHHHGEATLLFTTVRLSGHSGGFALARTTASNWPHISIVVASGHEKPNPGDMPEAACFIGKPFSARIVHEHLKRVIPDEKKPVPLRK